MAERNLTLEEFWKLSSTEDRGRHYCELSDHDKFLVRISMDPGAVACWCSDCAHYQRELTCKVFPNGIPKEKLIFQNQSAPVICGKGIGYTPKEGN